MNIRSKARMYLVLTIAGGMVIGLAGCGLTGSAPPTSTNQSTNAVTNQTNGTNASSNGTNQVAVNVTVSNNTTNSTTGNAATAGNNTTSSNQGSGNQSSLGTGTSGTGLTLQTATIGQASVQVPLGWSRSAIGSGDWSGWRYQNPKDPNEQVLVAFSGCIGCYTGADGKPSPLQAVPEQNATNVQLSSDGTSATYTVPSTKNPYQGAGKLTVTTDLSGYGYVEVYAPSSAGTLVQTVLNSFHVSAASS